MSVHLHSRSFGNFAGLLAYRLLVNRFPGIGARISIGPFDGNVFLHWWGR